MIIVIIFLVILVVGLFSVFAIKIGNIDECIRDAQHRIDCCIGSVERVDRCVHSIINETQKEIDLLKSYLNVEEATTPEKTELVKKAEK
jgi:hypothetical protein